LSREISLHYQDDQLLQPTQKNWLVLSHAFNMDGRAASQTMTDKVPYLLNQGISMHVLSAITGLRDERFPHKQLIAWGPSAFRFDFRHWVSNRYGRGFIYKFFTPLVSILLAPFIAIEKWLLGYSSQWSWSLPAYFYGRKLIRDKKVNVIYTAASAWSAHLAGLWLKKSTGLPWLVEIHDPMVIRTHLSEDGKKISRNRDAKMRYWLESQICKHADLAWWFTDGAVHYAKLRNPNLDTIGNAKSFMVLPGANPPLSNQVKHHYNNTLNLCHFGSLANDRSLSQIIEVLPNFFRKYPEAREVLRIHAYGSQLDALSKESIQRLGYSEIVQAHGRIERDLKTGLSGREQIAILMNQADILILLHGITAWCQEYIPSKLYEYFWVPRPIWGLTYSNPQLDQLLDDRGAYISCSTNQLSIETQLERIWKDWLEKKLLEPKFQPISVENAVQQILCKAYGSQ
jgi:hypothetical protein